MSNSMRPKHTPGPWTVEEHGLSPYEIWNQNTKVAVVNEKHEGHTNGLIEDTANARLIAAAPELLEAFEKFVSIVFSDVGLSREHMKLLSETGFREAIFKATGGDRE